MVRQVIRVAFGTEVERWCEQIDEFVRNIASDNENVDDFGDVSGETGCDFEHQ